MEIVVWILVTLQIIAAVVLIGLIGIQTTKSEQSGGGMGGWGTIGGQVSSSISKFGQEAQLRRLTAAIAIGFFVLSLLSAVADARLIHR
jgi:protein translocase SecG subunit